MKRCFLILISLLFIGSFANAQYRINKTKYDYRTYSHQAGDRYSPIVAGVTSYILPGLGQMLSGEGGRGAAFLGGDFTCTAVFIAGVIIAGKDNINTGVTIASLGLLGWTAIDIWAIVDAVRVAKVNNLSFRDKNKTSINLQINPYIDHYNYNITGKLQPGISLKFTF